MKTAATTTTEEQLVYYDDHYLKQQIEQRMLLLLKNNAANNNEDEKLDAFEIAKLVVAEIKVKEEKKQKKATLITTTTTSTKVTRSNTSRTTATATVTATVTTTPTPTTNTNYNDDVATAVDIVQRKKKMTKKQKPKKKKMKEKESSNSKPKKEKKNERVVVSDEQKEQQQQHQKQQQYHYYDDEFLKQKIEDQIRLLDSSTITNNAVDIAHAVVADIKKKTMAPALPATTGDNDTEKYAQQDHRQQYDHRRQVPYHNNNDNNNNGHTSLGAAIGGNGTGTVVDRNEVLLPSLLSSASSFDDDNDDDTGDIGLNRNNYIHTWNADKVKELKLISEQYRLTPSITNTDTEHVEIQVTDDNAIFANVDEKFNKVDVLDETIVEVEDQIMYDSNNNSNINNGDDNAQFQYDTITIGRISFHSKEKLHSWLEQNIGVDERCENDIYKSIDGGGTTKVSSLSSVQYFIDAHSLMCLALHGMSTKNKVLEYHANAIRAGYSSIQEALIVSSYYKSTHTSYDHGCNELPWFFRDGDILNSDKNKIGTIPRDRKKSTASDIDNNSDYVLPGVPSYEYWDGNNSAKGVGVQYWYFSEIKSMMNKLISAVDDAPISQDGKQVAIESIQTSHDFLKKLGEWMTTQHKDYTTFVPTDATIRPTSTKCSYSSSSPLSAVNLINADDDGNGVDIDVFNSILQKQSNKAWSLISSCVRAIFRDIYASRMDHEIEGRDWSNGLGPPIIINNDNNNNSQIIRSNIVWGSLQAVQKMNEYLDVGFSNHPTISNLFRELENKDRPVTTQFKDYNNTDTISFPYENDNASHRGQEEAWYHRAHIDSITAANDESGYVDEAFESIEEERTDHQASISAELRTIQEDEDEGEQDFFHDDDDTFVWSRNCGHSYRKEYIEDRIVRQKARKCPVSNCGNNHMTLMELEKNPGCKMHLIVRRLRLKMNESVRIAAN